MRKVLVFGGTRYFGKRLVELLLKNGDDVTIATRGLKADPFGSRVKRIVVNRGSKSSMEQAFSKNQEWDVIYDNICYSPFEAKITADLFKGKVKKYIFTSTLSVYEPRVQEWMESDFDPNQYTYKEENTREVLIYGEGKRQAEALFFQTNAFPVMAARFPIVLGLDDYTKRLHFHVNHIKSNEAIHFPNLNADISFISSEEVAGFLFWLSNHSESGAFNACSNGTIELADLVRLVEKETGQSAVLVESEEGAGHSPFGTPENWTLNNDKASKQGFQFKNLSEWLPELIAGIHRNELSV